VTNFGTIIGGAYGYGVRLQSNGSVTNNAGATISGGESAVQALGAPGTVTNFGTIMGTHSYSIGVYLARGGVVTNGIAGSINGPSQGVYISQGGTVTNFGTIAGTYASVHFNGVGTNVLTLGTGSVLNGPAIGSTVSGATNTLNLIGSGTAANIFQNFDALNVNAAGLWTLNGSSSIGTTTGTSGNLQIGDAANSSAQLTSTGTGK